MVRRFTYVLLSGLTVITFSRNATGSVRHLIPDSSITSGNPIITHIRSADPAAEVWDDGRVWLFASHDQEDATDYSSLDGYHVFSSFDLVNWTDHGEILHSRDVSWGNPDGGWMFAPDAAFKNGTYYFYFPHLSNEWQWRVGVATSDRPEGPYTDIGHFIEGTDNIDPACFVDDDGQAYLLWGGGGEDPKIAKLRENMTELAEEPRIIEYGAGNFGEGGYMHKRNGIYYFSYTCNTCYPFQGYYSTGDSPYGPFAYKGELNPNPPGAQDHHSIVEFHGQSYYFYHVGNYGAGGSAYRRNICIDSLFYNEDGTMKVVNQTTTGVGLDLIGGTEGIIIPGRIEGENYFRQSGIDALQTGGSATVVTNVQHGDWIEYVLRVLGTEQYMATLMISDPLDGTTLHFLVDDELTDTLNPVPDTGTITMPFSLHEGKHTLKILFNNSNEDNNLLDLDWIEMAGEKKYYSITAAASGGGSVQPGGTTYYETGETAVYAIEADDNHILDSMKVDGKLQESSSFFTFSELSQDHTLEAWFSECPGFGSGPFYQVEDGAVVHGTEVRLTEGDDLKLGVAFGDPGEVSWSGPGGVTGAGNEFYTDSISANQAGTYTAAILYGQGCIEHHVFSVTVDYISLDVYEAEVFSGQSGIRLEPCYDLGGGKFVGSIENGDWCSYTIGIEEPGIYALNARVATAAQGGTMEVTEKDSLLAEIPVTGALSGGWQNWYTTVPVEAGLEDGIHRLKFTFKGGPGSLFNFNWFDLDFQKHFGQGTHAGLSNGPGIRFNVYPNPILSNVTFEYTLESTSRVELTIFDAKGAVIRTLVPGAKRIPGTYTLTWNAVGRTERQVPKGTYYVRLRSSEEVVIKKLILL